jgi:MYXO-CTERM domain-containing protein
MTLQYSIPRVLLLCSLSVTSWASVVTVDENGHGNIDGAPISYRLAQDPGPGGLPNVLTYGLPFSGTGGDVELLEPETSLPGDVLRFDGNGSLLFYSVGTAPNTPDLADQPLPPFPAGNTIELIETAAGDVFYTPQPGQPGYDPATVPTYHFLSDSGPTAPEPGTAWAGVVAAAGLLLLRRRRNTGRSVN